MTQKKKEMTHILAMMIRQQMFPSLFSAERRLAPESQDRRSHECSGVCLQGRASLQTANPNCLYAISAVQETPLPAGSCPAKGAGCPVNFLIVLNLSAHF